MPSFIPREGILYPSFTFTPIQVWKNALPLEGGKFTSL